MDDKRTQLLQDDNFTPGKTCHVHESINTSPLDLHDQQFLFCEFTQPLTATRIDNCLFYECSPEDGSFVGSAKMTQSVVFNRKPANLGTQNVICRPDPLDQTILNTLEHTPDITKIAKPLQSLPWKAMDSIVGWVDGSVFLVATPIISQQSFRYEYHVVTVHIDSEYFDIYCNGEYSDLGWDNCDWYVVIYQRMIDHGTTNK